MEIKEAYEILKKDNPLLKPLSIGVTLWKKVVFEYFEKEALGREVKQAVMLIAVSLNDDVVYKRYFEYFMKENDDEIRKFMVEILRDNCNDIVIDRQLSLIGVRNSVYDRYVRQIVSQNVSNAIKTLLSVKPFRANVFIMRLKKNLLNDENTFTRMNAAIILRNIGDKKSLPELEKRLEEEKRLILQGESEVGIPYVIRELERSIMALKERA